MPRTPVVANARAVVEDCVCRNALAANRNGRAMECLAGMVDVQWQKTASPPSSKTARRVRTATASCGGGGHFRRGSSRAVKPLELAATSCQSRSPCCVLLLHHHHPASLSLPITWHRDTHPNRSNTPTSHSQASPTQPGFTTSAAVSGCAPASTPPTLPTRPALTASTMSKSQQDQFIDDDEEETCPLCVEEFDLTDKGFRPCPCGYQVRHAMSSICS